MPTTHEEPDNSHEAEPKVAQVDTTVPHSGVNFDEQPVREFDKTSLQEAADLGVLGKVPESVEGLTAPIRRIAPQEQPRRSRTKAYIAGGLLALTAVAGIAFDALKTSDKPEQTPTELGADTPPVKPAVDTEPQNTENSDGNPVTPEKEVTGPFTTVERSNGEVVKVKHITDDDIKSGQAAYILKEVAGLFMTTGDEQLLSDFVYRPDLVEAVGSWRLARQELGIAESYETGGDAGVKYDTRGMVVEVISVTESKAKILMKNDQDLYTNSFLKRWEEFKFNDYSKVTYEFPDNSDEHFANFTKEGDKWQFTGYTTAE